MSLNYLLKEKVVIIKVLYNFFRVFDFLSFF